MNTQTTHNTDILCYAINNLENTNEGLYGCDLHNELFNTDYFIIGRYEAEQWLIKNVGIFSAIDTIKEYEEFNFGDVKTDLTESEKVVNMYVYIKGEEILSNIELLQEKWNDSLTNEDIQAIKIQLQELL